MTDAKKSSVKAKPKAVWKSKPDWTKKEDYPDPKEVEITMEEWAWEFLRRNPEYRKDYESVQKRIEELKSQYEGAEEEWFQMREANVYIPELLPEEEENLDKPPFGKNNFLINNGEKAWRIRVESMEKKPRKLGIDRFHAENWGLAPHLINPDSLWDTKCHFLPPEHPLSFPYLLEDHRKINLFLAEYPVQLNDEETDVEFFIPKNRAIIVFDLDKSATGQLTAAKQMFASKKKKMMINKQDDLHKKISVWIKYLRVLDGIRAGSSLTDISEKINENQKTVESTSASSQAYDWLKAAHNIQKNYRQIGAGALPDVG